MSQIWKIIYDIGTSCFPDMNWSFLFFFFFFPLKCFFKPNKYNESTNNSKNEEEKNCLEMLYLADWREFIIMFIAVELIFHNILN